jgi:hypothetical protein
MRVSLSTANRLLSVESVIGYYVFIVAAAVLPETLHEPDRYDKISLEMIY